MIDAVQLPVLGAAERESATNEKRHRKILHAEQPLNPLHRVEVIFARIFLVFRPSSRIGVQGSRFSLFRSRVLSLPVLLLPRHRCRESAFFFYLSPSRRPSVNSFSFLSFHRAAHRHGQFSRPRSRAASEQRKRARITASARENLKTILQTISKYTAILPSNFEKSSFRRQFQFSGQKTSTRANSSVRVFSI